MSGLFILFSNAATGCVRTLLFLFLVFRLLPSEKPMGKKPVIMILSGIIVISGLLTITGPSDFYRVLSETIYLVVCASRLQGSETRISLFLGIFYEIALSFWQFLTAAWLGVFFHSPAFLDYGTINGQSAVCLFHVLLAAAILYFWRHSDLTVKKTYRPALVIVLTGFFAVVTLSQQSSVTIADDTLGMWTILAVVLMMSLLVFNINRQYEIEKELADLKSAQAELLEHDYTTLNHVYSVNAKLFHDFHNHMGALRQLLSHKKLEEAIQYLDELQSPLGDISDTLWTGHETIDYLINSKAQTAASNGIQYQIQVEFPRHTNLKSTDLCAILGNLLDNALEAAAQMPEGKERFVRLMVRRINQMLIIKVENSFYVPPALKNGSLKTSKKENGLHGWGIKSACAAAEKYDGTLQTSYSDNIFRAVVTLSYQGVST